MRRNEIRDWFSRKKVISALAASLLLLIFSGVSLGQGTGAIQGTVSDEQGGKISGAEVRLISRSGTQLSTTTNNNGTFIFANLPSARYLIEVRAGGFSTYVSEEIGNERGKTIQREIVLAVAGVSENVVVTAAGTAQRDEEVSKVVSILDAATIDSKHELNLPEALRGTAGVRVQQQGSPGALTTIRLRGQRTYDTAILLDGLRVRDASDIGGSAASLTTDLVPVATDRVEVLRGAGSSIYGTNAIGGVINIVPETSTAGLHFDVGAEAGGLRTFRERLKVSGGSQRVGFTLGLNRLDIRRGVDGEDQYGNSAGSGRFLFAPSSSTTIAVNLYGTISNARLNDSPFALPAAFGGSQPFPQAIAGVSFQPDFNNPDQGRRHRLLVGSVKFSQQINERVSYSLAYQRSSSHRRNYNGPQIDPQFASAVFYPFGEFEFMSVNRGTIDTFDARLNARLARSNLATVGFEFERESLFQQSIPSFSAFNNTTDKQRTFAVFGQDQLSFFDDRLQLSIAARAQFFRIRAADRPGSLQGIDAEKSITGDGSIAYLIRSSNTKLRAHVGNGFRAASLFERFGAGTFQGLGLQRFGDPTLRAEQSISVDAGVEQRFSRALFGVTYFYTRLQRIINFNSFFLVDPLGLGRFNGYENRPGGLARGVETFLETAPWKGGELRASYTFTNSDRQVSLRGLQQEYVIPHHAFGFSLHQRYRAFAFNFDLNHTGSHIAPVFENNVPFRTAELTFDGFTKADLFGSYERQVSEGATMILFAGAENLFDQRYYENGFLGPGIVGRGGVRFKF